MSGDLGENQNNKVRVIRVQKETEDLDFEPLKGRVKNGTFHLPTITEGAGLTTLKKTKEKQKTGCYYFLVCSQNKNNEWKAFVTRPWSRVHVVPFCA